MRYKHSFSLSSWLSPFLTLLQTISIKCSVFMCFYVFVGESPCSWCIRVYVLLPPVPPCSYLFTFWLFRVEGSQEKWIRELCILTKTNCSLLQFILRDNISKNFLQRASTSPRVMSLTCLGLWSFPVRNFQNPIADLLLGFRLCIWNIILQPKWQFLCSKKKNDSISNNHIGSSALNSKDIPTIRAKLPSHQPRIIADTHTGL